MDFISHIVTVLIFSLIYILHGIGYSAYVVIKGHCCICMYSWCIYRL